MLELNRKKEKQGGEEDLYGIKFVMKEEKIFVSVLKEELDKVSQYYSGKNFRSNLTLSLSEYPKTALKIGNQREILTPGYPGG